MKRVFFAALAVAMISSSAMGGWWITDAKVDWIEVKQSGATYVRIKLGTAAFNYKISELTSKGEKAMIAVALTALSTGKNVSAEVDGPNYIRFYIKQ